MDYIQKLRLLLDRDTERHLLWLVAFSILMSIIETIGISAILPFIDIATNFNKIQSNQYYQWIFNFFDFEENVNFVIFFGFILFGFYIIRGATNLLYSYLAAHFIQNLYAKLTKKLFNVYLKMPYQVFTKKNSSYLNKAIITEAALVAKVYGSILIMITETLVLVFLYMLMLSVSWKITVIFTIILLLELLLLKRTVSKKIKNVGEIRANVHSSIYEIINRFFSNFKHIKLQDEVIQKEISNDFSLSVNKYAKVNTDYIFLSSFPRIFLETTGFSVIILFLVGLLVINTTNISYILPTLSLFVLALYRLLPSVNRILRGYNVLMFHQKSAGIINKELQIIQENLKHEKVAFKYSIKLSKVNFSYNKKSILQNIFLTITKGEKIAFIGESGSGKSTLVDLITGLYQPNKGELSVDDVLIDHVNLQNWRSQIGYIPQQIYLFDGTIAENVCFGRKLDKVFLEKVLRQANIFKFLLTKQGIDTLVGEGGIQLSGGQKQRIAIARALYGRPEILVLDEATSALDEKTEKKIMEEIYKISQDKTLIIVAHRLSTIKNCDVVYQINDGLLKSIT